MRLSIDHHSIYRFSEPQARVVQLLRVTPTDYAGQTVIDWRIDVDCDARLRTGFDGFGNATTMLYIDGPIESVALTVRGEVLTEDMGGIVEGAHEPLPPLFYTRATPLTEPSKALVELSRSVGGSDPLEKLHGLNALVGEKLDILTGQAVMGRSPTDILKSGQSTARGAAHVLTTLARLSGYPARVVSGHSRHGPARGSRQSGHYWVEIHLKGRGWIGFDPYGRCSPDESYVRVAVGLDASDATPVSGTRKGGGVEELDVAVRVGSTDQ